MAARRFVDGDHAFVEDGHILDHAADIGALIDGDLVLDPIGEGNIAKVHALLEDEALAILHEHAILAGVMALLDAQFGQEVLQRLLLGGGFGGANGNIEGGFESGPLGIQRAA